MSNPIDEALEAIEATKTAGPMDFLRFAGGAARGALQMAPKGPLPLRAATAAGHAFGEDMGRQGMENLVTGAGIAAGGAVITGLGAAASKIYESISRKSEYREMMQVNPELEGLRQENPQFFAQAYNSLRRVNPTYGRDPVIAAAFMNKMMMQGPATAGQTLAQTIKTPDAPKRDLGLRVEMGPLAYQRGMRGAP